MLHEPARKLEVFEWHSLFVTFVGFESTHGFDIIRQTFAGFWEAPVIQAI